MKEVLVLPNENLSTSEKSAENPRVLSCTSFWVDKGPEGAELRGSEKAAGGSEQGHWSGHICSTLSDLSSLSQFYGAQFASPGIVRCGTFQLLQRLYHSSICSIVPNMNRKDNLDRHTSKEKSSLGEKINKQTKKLLQSPIKSNQEISGPDYTAEEL